MGISWGDWNKVTDGQDRIARFEIPTLILNSISTNYILIKTIANLNNLTIMLYEKIFGKEQNIKLFGNLLGCWVDKVMDGHWEK